METSKKIVSVSPRKSANFISVLFFAWSIPIFKKGLEKQLDSSDIYEPLEEDCSDQLGNRLER